MKTVLLLNHAPNPRMQKRVAVLKRHSEVHVICLKRINMDIWTIDPEQYSSIEYIEMAVPSSNHLIRRFLVTRRFRKFAHERIKLLDPDLIYTELLDCLLIAVKAKRCLRSCFMIYEVADIREALLKEDVSLLGRMKQQLIRKIECKAFKQVDRLVVTSERFYDDYYVNLISSEKVIFAPNAPDPSVFSRYIEKKDKEKFTVGFIGVIRYVEQLKLLVDACDKSDVCCLIAGAAISAAIDDEIRQYSDKKNVVFTGRYCYKKEIVDIYSRVDCIFSVYDADNPNVKIALPNKLYEAVYCGLPIIVAKGTYLSDLVDKWGVGISVNHHDVDEFVKAICLIKTDKQFRLRIKANCERARLEGFWANWECSLDSFCSRIELTPLQLSL